MTTTQTKKTLGSSNVEVSALAMGTVPLAGFGAASSREDFESTVLAAVESGVRYFDTAPMYGAGRAEQMLGHVLRYNGLRQQVVVSTKVGRVLKTRRRVPAGGPAIFGIDWVGGLPFVEQFDYSYDGIMRSFEDSQQRMGLDQIDIVHVHDIGRVSHGEGNAAHWKALQQGGFRALRELRESGAVRAIGIGVNETGAVLEMANEFPLDCCLVAGRYTLINDEASRDFYPECRRRGIGVIAAGVFNSGILAGGAAGKTKTFDYMDAPTAIVERVAAVEQVCARFGVTLPTAAIQFVHAHPAVATILVGAKSPAEIAQNASALNASVPSAFWSELKQQGLLAADALTP
jgi:D-threo-aldose 1-dehydrogenase